MSPVVHGTRTFLRKVLPLHTIGLLIGAIACGVLAIGIGESLRLLVPERPLAVGAAVVIAVYSTAELLPHQPWRPQSLWQVPEGFRRTRYVGSMAFLWGVPLGFGWATATITAAFFGVFLAMAVVTPVAALAAAVAFGLARATTLLLTVGGENFDAVADRFLRIAGHTGLARITTAVLGTALAVGLTIPN
jgi:hypothetical protein